MEKVSVKEELCHLFEVRRQIFHFFLGMLIILLLIWDVLDLRSMAVICLAGFILALVSKRWKLPIIQEFLETFERKEAMKTLPGKGALFFFLGCTVSLALFPKPIALAGIAILTFGDSVSHIVGSYFGAMCHPLNSKKLFEGSIAGTFAAFVAALFFVLPMEDCIRIRTGERGSEAI